MLRELPLQVHAPRGVAPQQGTIAVAHFARDTGWDWDADGTGERLRFGLVGNAEDLHLDGALPRAVQFCQNQGLPVAEREFAIPNG
jgi:hypothetical protein